MHFHILFVIAKLKDKLRLNAQSGKLETVSCNTRMGGYLDHLLLSREEAILHVLAHERGIFGTQESKEVTECGGHADNLVIEMPMHMPLEKPENGVAEDKEDNRYCI